MNVEDLMNEVRRLWNTMVQAGERLHHDSPVTLGQRAVLEHLLLQGPCAVPRIADARRVTRQHIQALANGLLEQKFVEPTANPAHRRSPLLRLTAKGERTIRRLRQRESRALSRLPKGPGEAALRQATNTLRRLRAGLERLT
jgi:DNA-binding MarR family transcriptional regulator